MFVISWLLQMSFYAFFILFVEGIEFCQMKKVGESNLVEEGGFYIKVDSKIF